MSSHRPGYFKERYRKLMQDPVFRAKHAEYNRAWRAKKTLEDPEWAVMNKKRQVASAVDWRKNNIDRWKASVVASEKRRREADPLGVMLHKKRNSAKKLGIEFNISKEDIELPEVCPILQIPIAPFLGKRKDNCASIDRIDPRKGYTKGNVKIISLRANRIKYNCVGPNELRAIANYIEENWPKEVDKPLN